MSRTVYISPTKPKGTVVQWTIGSKRHFFDSGIQFADALALLDLQVVVVFNFKKSSDSEFVGVIFDFQGKEIGKIPFPDAIHIPTDTYSVYKWSVETENGVKITFGTNSISIRDYWCDFDIEKHLYTAFGEAR